VKKHEEMAARWLTAMSRVDYSEREDFLHSESDRLAVKATKKELAYFRVILRAATCDPAMPVRDLAVGLMMDFGKRGDQFCVIARCSDPEWMVRATAASTIGNAFPKYAKKHVIPMLRDVDPIVRRYAAVALWDAIGKECEEVIREELATDPVDLARIGLVGVLLRCGDLTFLPEMEGYAASPHRWLSGLAQETLKEIKDAEVKQ
jgi:HEAT repeat protein